MTCQVNKNDEISNQIKSEIHDFLDLTTIYNNPNTKYMTIVMIKSVRQKDE